MKSQREHILGLLQAGKTLVANDGEFEYKVSRYTPKQIHPLGGPDILLEGEFKLTSRVHWASTPGLAIILDNADQLIVEMRRCCPLSEWQEYQVSIVWIDE